MNGVMIDCTFDLRSDAKRRNGKPGDPDKYSPTLRSYHQLLWSKNLPNGKLFDLETNSGKGYLYHNSALGEYVLTSDSVLPTFIRRKSYLPVVSQLSAEEREEFDYKTYTIGGMMIFPGNKVDGRITINGARGFNRKIGDRFDLTVECIRRYYLDEPSPLSGDLQRYREFFELFSDFRGYVEFFLLQDLVDEVCSKVNIFTEFDDFKTSPLPNGFENYKLYRDKTLKFVELRNQRMLASLSEGSPSHADSADVSQTKNP